MRRLHVDGVDTAGCEVAATPLARLRGLLGRRQLDGALLITATSSIHTLGMRFPIDVAFCDSSLVVLRVRTVERNRFTFSVKGATSVVEAEAGKFSEWKLKPGSKLNVQ